MVNSSDILLTYNGKEQSLTDWGEELNVPVSSIRARWNKSQKEGGWDPDQILFGKAGASLEQGSSGSSSQPVTRKVNGLMANIQRYLEESIAALCIDEVYDQVAPKIKQRLVDDLGFTPEIHKVIGSTFSGTFEGTTHEVFDDILQLVYNNVPVLLKGDAGSGKLSY